MPGLKKRQVRQGPAFKGSYTRKSAHIVGCINSIMQRRTGTRRAEIRHVPQLVLRYTEELIALRRWNMRQRHGGEREYEASGGVGCAWGRWEDPRLERQAEAMCFPKWVRASFHQSHLLNCSFRRWRPGICILTSSPLIFEKHWYIASFFLFYRIRDQIRKRQGIHQTSGSWENILHCTRNSGFGASGWGTKWKDRHKTAWRKHTRSGI